MKRIRLAVADDHRLFLEGIRVALGSADDIEIVGEADSGSKLVTLVANTRPDHVLMDYAMPQLDGLACLDTGSGSPTSRSRSSPPTAIPM